ncbi:hypothetical protein [Streptomyces griseoruber]|uniref:hypothetical protein n=1 Tax=Streptomyces griseoruber TaxID=1943 RepID=UPI000A84558A|nr:hypothetical protein [Streptomyces griseoruber]
MDDDMTIHIDTLTVDLTPDAVAALLMGDHDVLVPAILAALRDVPSGTYGGPVHQRPS